MSQRDVILNLIVVGVSRVRVNWNECAFRSEAKFICTTTGGCSKSTYLQRFMINPLWLSYRNIRIICWTICGGNWLMAKSWSTIAIFELDAWNITMPILAKKYLPYSLLSFNRPVFRTRFLSQGVTSFESHNSMSLLWTSIWQQV